MTRRLGLVAGLLALLMMMWGGCIVRTPHHRSRHHRVKVKHHRRPHHRHHRVKVRHNCPPSHYWDGARCRHRGRGHGARRHDY